MSRTVKVPYHTTAQGTIEFASELGERFPDMTNNDIILACEEFTGRKFTYYERTVLIVGYDHGYDAALKEAKIWGVF